MSSGAGQARDLQPGGEPTCNRGEHVRQQKSQQHRQQAGSARRRAAPRRAPAGRPRRPGESWAARQVSQRSGERSSVCGPRSGWLRSGMLREPQVRSTPHDTQILAALAHSRVRAAGNSPVVVRPGSRVCRGCKGECAGRLPQRHGPGYTGSPHESHRGWAGALTQWRLRLKCGGSSCSHAAQERPSGQQRGGQPRRSRLRWTRAARRPARRRCRRRPMSGQGCRPYRAG